MTDIDDIPDVDSLVEQYEKAAVTGQLAQELALLCAAPAWDVRQKVAGLITSVPVGVHFNPFDEHYGLHAVNPTSQDIALMKAACSRVGSVRHDMLDDVAASNGEWIKVAYSKPVRWLGEALNFFPGNPYAGAPNFPSPLAATLTSGLVGAGLGYGGGALIERFLPDKWKKNRLRNTLAALGGMAGAAPGLAWMYTNVARGVPWNDNSLLNHPPTTGHADYGTPDQLSGELNKKFLVPARQEPEPVQFDSRFSNPSEALPTDLGNKYMTAVDHYVDTIADDRDRLLKEAFDSDTGAAGGAFQSRQATPLDTNVDLMGRVLWDTGASPQLAAQTMGALYAAQQMPSPRSRPGWVTPGQMASLAANMGAGYISGALVGSALGLLTGMPEETQDKLKQTGMYLGVVQSVVPHLFGQ